MTELRAVFLGFGGIARALYSLRPFATIHIIDKEDVSDVVREMAEITKIPTTFHQIKIVPQHSSNGTVLPSAVSTSAKCLTTKELAAYCLRVGAHILVDCSYNVDTLELLQSLPPRLSYINTSIEYWEHDGQAVISSLKERQDAIAKWYKDARPPNAILLDCGMNPGLISMWAAQACTINKIARDDVEQCIISEYDTQSPRVPRRPREFVNTWSPDGFLEEVHSPTEGHSNGKYYIGTSTTNVIGATPNVIGATGFETKSVSLRPSGEAFEGYTVRHGEAITLHKILPRATLMYIYRCPAAADESLQKDYRSPTPLATSDKRIIFGDAVESGGVDELGVLIATRDRLIWYGSMLGIDDTRAMPCARFVNATTMQVAGGLWMGIMALWYCAARGDYRLMTPEDVVDLPLAQLDNVNRMLRVVNVEMDVTTPNAKRFMARRGFEEHHIGAVVFHSSDVKHQN